jgi:hypothetical protein
VFLASFFEFSYSCFISFKFSIFVSLALKIHNCTDLKLVRQKLKSWKIENTSTKTRENRAEIVNRCSAHAQWPYAPAVASTVFKACWDCIIVTSNKQQHVRFCLSLRETFGF